MPHLFPDTSKFRDPLLRELLEKAHALVYESGYVIEQTHRLRRQSERLIAEYLNLSGQVKAQKAPR